MNSMSMIKISISVNEDTLKAFDEKIGLVPRSTYINAMMEKEIKRLSKPE